MDRKMENESKDTIRLQAYLAMCGIGSRRSCETLIREGRVSVEGKIALLGMSVTMDSSVSFDGKIVQPQTRLRYIALNKPTGYLSSMSDPEGRPLAIDLLKGEIKERIYNVGRLDQWSSGLLLFSNDGYLAARMTHPSGGFDKEYLITADKEIPAELPERFTRGVEIDGIVYKAISVIKHGPRECNIVLLEGRNREIRRVFEYFGLRAMTLKRVRIGPLSLGNLQEGKWRELSEKEVRLILEHTGEARA
jgi:23S rRNA pseudouridine2605 synthase